MPTFNNNINNNNNPHKNKNTNQKTIETTKNRQPIAKTISKLLHDRDLELTRLVEKRAHEDSRLGLFLNFSLTAGLLALPGFLRLSNLQHTNINAPKPKPKPACSSSLIHTYTENTGGFRLQVPGAITKKNVNLRISSSFYAYCCCCRCCVGGVRFQVSGFRDKKEIMYRL